MTEQPKIDFHSINLRRTMLLEQRLEQVHLSLYVAVIAVLIAMLIALVNVRTDLLNAIRETR